MTDIFAPITLGAARLYCGDSLDILPLLEPEQFTACVCDPLCGAPHNGSSVAQSVMWPSSFLNRFSSVALILLRHIISAYATGRMFCFPIPPEVRLCSINFSHVRLQ